MECPYEIDVVDPINRRCRHHHLFLYAGIFAIYIATLFMARFAGEWHQQTNADIGHRIYASEISLVDIPGRRGDAFGGYRYFAKKKKFIVANY